MPERRRTPWQRYHAAHHDAINARERERRQSDPDYAAKRREQIRKSCAKWRAANPDKAKASTKRWYERHKEREQKRALVRYYANPGPAKARSKATYHANREALLADQKRRQKIVKDAVYAAYGGYTCRCCAESNPGFLTLDHINGCTREQRKREGLGGGLVRYLKRHEFPPGYQVLCFNCNLGRAINGGACPHKSP